MDTRANPPTGLILGGVRYGADDPYAPPVYNWHDTGLETKIGGNNKRRQPDQQIDLFVVHWTGGFGDAERLFRVLERRTLGVEFFIDYDGAIFQFCDPVEVNTADAGYVNPRSVGVEVRCAGFPSKDSRRHRDDQPHYRGTIRGRTLRMVDFTEAQHESLLWLIDTIRIAHDPQIVIPRKIPRDDDGTPLRRTMTRAEVRNFAGVIGHFHISKRKTDPGTEPMARLALEGFR